MYHGRIVLPTEYPFKPPDIILLTVRVVAAFPPGCGRWRSGAPVLMTTVLRLRVAQRPLRSGEKDLPDGVGTSSRMLATVVEQYALVFTLVRHRTVVADGGAMLGDCSSQHSGGADCVHAHAGSGRRCLARVHAGGTTVCCYVCVVGAGR